MKQLIEARLQDIELDYRYPYACLDFLREMVMETTEVLDRDFAPEEHFVYFKLPIGEYNE